MSTKVYYAWRIDRMTTVQSVRDCVEKIRPLCIAHMHEKLRELAVRTLPEGGDLKQHYNKEFWSIAGFGLAGDAKDKWREMLMPELDIIFIPSRGGMLLMPFSSRFYDYNEIIGQNARYWGYWNNVDRDDTCSAREWAQRRRDWNKAFDEHSSYPIELGLSIRVVGQYLPVGYQLWPGPGES